VSEQQAQPLAPATLVHFFTQYLTPAFWRQAHQANPNCRGTRAQRQRQAHDQPRRYEHKKRWELQPLLTVLLLLSWCQGDSLPERFETARACYVALHPKRRQPGKTCRGFALALERLPMPVLRALLAAVRLALPGWLRSCWRSGGFVVLGCDGSRLECPRSAALERAMGLSAKPKRSKKPKTAPPKAGAGGANKGPGKDNKNGPGQGGKGPRGAATAAAAGTPDSQADQEMSLPLMWLTAVVHLGSGVPYAWLLGKGNASEQRHLQRLAGLLPQSALVVTDAGYHGWALLLSLLWAKADFLIRLSSHTTLYTEDYQGLEKFEQGQVAYYWPQWAQKAKEKPIRVRAIRVRGCGKQEVWLLTSVLEEDRLSVKDAARYYKMRWGCEGFFRTYKRTLGQVKVRFDTPRLVFREVEVALLGAQLLLCQGAQAVPAAAAETAPAYSPREVLQALRREVSRLAGPRLRQDFAKALKAARAKRRKRSSAKEKRAWPRRKPHKPPKPPKILTMTEEQKALLSRCETGP
jgi:Transposase DDE domain